MRVLVTGGLGYVGTALVGKLRASGHGVRILDNLSSWGRSRPLEHSMGNLELIVGDIRDPGDVKRSVTNCDIVIHLAATVGYPACDANPTEAYTTNVDGTQCILEGSTGRPVVFLSSMSCLGRVASGWCDENTPPQPVSWYGRTKLQGENRVRSYGRSVVLRPATAFGVSPRTRLDLLPHQLIIDAIKQGYIEVYEPKAWRCFVHVADIADAIVFTIEHIDDLTGEVVHVGQPSLTVTKHTVAAMVREITGCDIIIDPDQIDADKRDYQCTFTKLATAGFRPRHDLIGGLLEFMSFADRLQGI